MTIQRYKVALNAARFPLSSTKGSRAVFIPGLDSSPRTPRAYVGAEYSADYNTTQLVYGENIVPVAEGYCSAAFEQVVAPGASTDFTDMFPLRDDQENTVLYSPSKGKNYIYNPGNKQWESNLTTDIFGVTVSASSWKTEETATVSYTYVEGYTFVCYSRLLGVGDVEMSLMYWDPTTQSLSSADSLLANIPFDPGTIDGVASASGYLILWSGLEVAWAPYSIQTSKFDFINYANGEYTGAGYSIPEDIKGNIRTIIGVSGGFLAFTSTNCIAASYHAQNILAPWLFREVAGAGGLDSYEQATVEGSLGTVYAFTTAGLQKITLNSAESFNPHVSDFISGRSFETYSPSTKIISTVTNSQDLALKLTNIGNRYLAISYGTTTTTFQYIILFDLQLERWGKLKFDHVDCFYYPYVALESNKLTYSMLADTSYAAMGTTKYSEVGAPPVTALVAAPHTLALMTTTGAIYAADWDINANRAGSTGVAIIGRVQMSRSRNVQLNRIEVEGLYNGTISVAPSYDGRNLVQAQSLTTIVREEDMYIGGTMLDCKNFDIIIEGGFNLSTLIIESTTSGQF